MPDDSRHAAASLLERLIAALRLDLRLYSEVSGDKAATGQAVLVVLIGGVCNGLGLARRLGRVAVWVGVGQALLSWLAWAVIIWLITRVLGHRQNGRSLLRALGFANAPAVLLILGVVPILGSVVRVVVALWLVATTVPAVQAVFEVSRRRAMVIAVTTFLSYLLLGLVSGYWAGS